MTPAGVLAPRARVRVEGVGLAADVSERLLSVRYESNADLADMFSLVLDNSASALTDSPLLELGRRVELGIGYGHDVPWLMVGSIASLSPSFPAGGAPTLTVTGYDRSQQLRHDAVTRPPWRGMDDSTIAAQIALERGLVPVVDPSPFRHDELPHEGTDWEFLERRARANAFDLFVRGDQLHFRSPRPQTQLHVLEWGRSLASFAPRLSSAGQAGSQVVRGYDADLAQAVVGLATAVDLDLDLDALAERLGSAALDTLTGLGRRVVRDEPVTSQLDAVTLARSLLTELLEGLYEGSGDGVGLPELRAGELVEVRGVGRRFSGRYRLRQVVHTLDAGGYRTSFDVTQRWATTLTQVLRTRSAAAPPGRSPDHPGVAVGLVTGVDAASHRVRVRLPGRSDTEDQEALCTVPWAGAGRGIEFLPDVGDQVVVAFQDGKLVRPVVLGSLWPSTATKPSGTRGVHRIATSAHVITLDDREGQEEVAITGKGGSTITMTADGTVRITAGKDLVLEAPAGDVEICGGTVRVEVRDVMDVVKATA